MYVTRNVSFHETVQYFGDASPLQGEKQDEANPLYQRMECTLDLDLHVNQNTANENESNKHATFDHEDQDTPYYDTKIDEDNNRDSTTTAGTENANETEPITINHPEVASATPNNTNIPDTPSSSVLQEMNDTSQARYPTRSNQANQDWPLKQFDVKNAFLNEYLKEEVYMDPPPGVECSGNVYKQSDADHTLFIKNNNNGKVTALIVYVDDMVVTENDPEEMKNLQTILATEFELKDLGHLKYFLGIEVARSKSGISMCQRKYVLDLLTETGMLDCKSIEMPIETNYKLSILPDQVPTNKERYQRLDGKLIYLSHTRPDIAYAMSVVSRFMHAPSKVHMKAVYRILKYLKSSPGYFTFVGGNLVTWRSKKQKVVSRSSAEAEFRGMLHCDNQAAVKIANNPVQHDRTKHVEIDRHFIKDHLEKKMMELLYVISKDQLADMLTKAIMPPMMRTRSAGRPAAESLGGGTGKRVSRGGRGRRPREGNDERVNDLNGQGNDQGMGANEGVEGVNRNVEGANGDAPDFSTIIAQQLQNLLPAMLAQVSNQGNAGNHNGCNPKEYDGKEGVVVLTLWIEKMEYVHDMSGCSIDQKVKYTAG
ncbi:ABC-2 type transporter family protein [Tanacetum coccineum]